MNKSVWLLVVLFMSVVQLNAEEIKCKNTNNFAKQHNEKYVAENLKEILLTANKEEYPEPGLSRLTQAALFGMFDIVSGIHLSSPEEFNFYSDDALLAAATIGDDEIVNYLLLNGANPNTEKDSRYGTPLVAAIGSGHERVVISLINYGANVNYKYRKKYTLIKLAEVNGYGCLTSLLKVNQEK